MTFEHWLKHSGKVWLSTVTRSPGSADALGPSARAIAPSAAPAATNPSSALLSSMSSLDLVEGPAEAG
jgi:hypothetical protein